MLKIPFNLTSESLTIVLNGETYTIKAGDPNFQAARNAVLAETWDAIPNLVSKGKTIEDWAKGLFTFKQNHLYFKDFRVPEEINEKVLTMAQKGEDPRPILRFFQRLQNNPSNRSVAQLFRFVANSKIPIGKDGCILAYKAVKKDYWDKHTGKTFQYKVGATIEMPRNQVSDDPNVACDPGLHVGARGYLGSDGSTGPVGYGNGDLWLIVKVDPADVVSVPYDYGSTKMRVCKLTVIGHYGCDLPDTIWGEEILTGVADPSDLFPMAKKATPVAPAPIAAPPPQPRDDGDDDVNLDDDSDEFDDDSDEDAFETENEEENDALPEDAELEEYLGELVAVPDGTGEAVQAPVATETRDVTLQARTLDDLRTYAKTLGIKNVKAILGGKDALISRIIAVEADPLQAKSTYATSTGKVVTKDTTAEVTTQALSEVEAVPALELLPEKPEDVETEGELTYGDIDKMEAKGLELLSLDILRKYARHRLAIVGASKIHGGKPALLKRILEVRPHVNPPTKE